MDERTLEEKKADLLSQVRIRTDDELTPDELAARRALTEQVKARAAERTVERVERTREGSWLIVYDDGSESPPFGSQLAAMQASLEQNATSTTNTAWDRVDLTRYLDGSYKPPTPTLMKRSDGVGLAYPGRVHWCSGEPGALKSWLALHACAVELLDGGSVVYIDFEDGAAGITGRLLALGVTAEILVNPNRFDYRSPEGPLTPGTRAALSDAIAAATLVIVDACTEALSAQGLSSKDDTDIATWLALLPRWAAKLGPAVLVLDHVIKDSEGRGRWATGSQHKLAGLDGVAYTLDNVQPGGVGLTGRSRLYISKDRHGQVEPHAVPSTGGKRWVGDLVVDSTGPFTDAVIHPPATHTETFVPTVVMTKVSEALSKAGKPLTKSEIEDRVGGRNTVVRQAIAALDDAGHLEIKAGPHNSRLHTLLTPYPRPEEDA